MRDFGSFFKGFDFDHTDKIEKRQAVQILQTLLAGTDAALDILQLAVLFADPDNPELFDIDKMASKVNRYISDSQFQIRLVSAIDKAVDDEILDAPSDMTFADEEKGIHEDEVQVPLGFEQVVIDLHCGLELEFIDMLKRLRRGEREPKKPTL